VRFRPPRNPLVDVTLNDAPGILLAPELPEAAMRRGIAVEIDLLRPSRPHGLHGWKK